MSSEIDREDRGPGEEDAPLDDTLMESEFDGEHIPPHAFYIALKNALVQLANQPTSYP